MSFDDWCNKLGWRLVEVAMESLDAEEPMSDKELADIFREAAKQWDGVKLFVSRGLPDEPDPEPFAESSDSVPFTCFSCGDGIAPLYCLNCARGIAGTVWRVTFTKVFSSSSAGQAYSREKDVTGLVCTSGDSEGKVRDEIRAVLSEQETLKEITEITLLGRLLERP